MVEQKPDIPSTCSHHPHPRRNLNNNKLQQPCLLLQAKKTEHTLYYYYYYYYRLNKNVDVLKAMKMFTWSSTIWLSRRDHVAPQESTNYSQTKNIQATRFMKSSNYLHVSMALWRKWTWSLEYAHPSGCTTTTCNTKYGPTKFRCAKCIGYFGVYWRVYNIEPKPRTASWTSDWGGGGHTDPSSRLTANSKSISLPTAKLVNAPETTPSKETEQSPLTTQGSLLSLGDLWSDPSLTRSLS